MKRAFQLMLGCSALVAVLSAQASVLAAAKDVQEQVVLGSRSKPLVEQSGLRFRDLNANGALDRYEDWRLPADVRARDLLGRMTLEEKAGLLAHPAAPTPGGFNPAATEYDLVAVGKLIDQGVATLLTRINAAPTVFAHSNNRLQELGEKSRLGIPLIISTDPRSHFNSIFGASTSSGAFSRWPEPLGFGALGDPSVTRTFADIVRQEYRAVGIHESLAPQADLATDPRWPRIDGTFGENPEAASRQVAAYVSGMQGGKSGLTRDGVIVVVKHWVGNGAQVDGFDSHNWYGRYARLSNRALALHERPFKAAFAVGAAGVMSAYSILQGPTISGKPLEQVGVGFNRDLLTGRLRNEAGFQGFVLSDWEIVSDCSEVCRGGWRPGTPPSVGMPWGVEHASVEQRIAKALNAGVDQLGGFGEPSQIVAVVKSGAVSTDRLDDAAYRLLVPRFQLGLFENPYVDPVKAEQIVGNPQFQRIADQTQRSAIVLLNQKDKFVPGERSKVFLRGVDSAAARENGFAVVERAEQADFAVIRLGAPFQRLHSGYFFGFMQHEGDLDYKPGNPDIEAVSNAAAHVPTIVAVELDRPAIVTPLRERATMLLATFGASDKALFDVIAGKARALGRLPVELPSSMAAVRAQDSGLPHDSRGPIYPIFYRFQPKPVDRHYQ